MMLFTIIQRSILPLLLFVFVTMSSFPVHAGEGSSPELTAAFHRILEEPGNSDLLYEYAQTAIKDGNFEAAIGALEGMLVTASNQPRILLELGALYQRLGSTVIAEHYLQNARVFSGENKAISELAGEYLGISEKQNSRQSFTGVIRVGGRFQSNPTLSPESVEILSGGFNVPLPAEREAESDSNGLLFSHISHRFRFNPRVSLASEAIIYETVYNDNNQLNYGALELTIGPLFESPGNAQGQQSLQPHIVLRGSHLDGSFFEQTGGLGLDYRWAIGATNLVTARYQFRHLEYEDFDGYGTAPRRNGNEHRVVLRYKREVIRGQLLQVGLFGRYRDSEYDYLDLDQYDISLRYSFKLDNFLFEEGYRMSVSPHVILRFKDFGAPNPEVTPDKTRSDHEWRLGLNYLLPITKRWSLLFEMEHVKADSNIINYDVSNNLFMGSVQIGF